MQNRIALGSAQSSAFYFSTVAGIKPERGLSAMVTAKDIMSSDVVSVKEDTPIYEALQILLKSNITGVPVVKDNMILVGIFSEKDALGLFFRPKSASGRTVADFMTQPAIFFDEDEKLSDVCECLMNSYFRRVPVTNKGKVVGIISRPDIIAHICRLILDSGGTS